MRIGSLSRAMGLLGLVGTLALAGCGPPPYQKTGASAAEQGRDEADCRRQAKEPRESRDIVGGVGGVTNYPFSDFDLAAYDSCMKERGYSRAP